MISILCSNLDLTNSPFYFGVLLTLEKYSLKIKLRRKDKLLHFPNKSSHCFVLSWHTPPKQKEDLLLHVCKSAALISGTQNSDTPLQNSGKSHGSMLFLHGIPLSSICKKRKNT